MRTLKLAHLLHRTRPRAARSALLKAIRSGARRGLRGRGEAFALAATIDAHTATAEPERAEALFASAERALGKAEQIWKRTGETPSAEAVFEKTRLQALLLARKRNGEYHALYRELSETLNRCV